MRRGFRFPLMLAVAAAMAAPVAHAAEKACLIEGSFTIGGETTQTRGCTENNGLPPEDFKEMCKSMAGVTSGLPGGKSAKVTYPASCPAKAQAVCQGLWGQPLSGYYYETDADTLARARKMCESKGGKFKSNP